MELVCTGFKNLKVLVMRSVDSESIPEEIGDLVLLKYLGLMGGEEYSEKPLIIPPSISKLKKLQTLLGSTKRRYIVPTEICELHELKIDDNKEEVEEGNGYTLESIANLTSLQTLCLWFKSAVIPTMKPLSSCNRLKSVYLWGTLKDPSELYFLPHSVTDLTQYSSEFIEDHMPTLGSLSNLNGLELFGVYSGNKMVCSQFPSLQILRLKWLSNLEEFQVEDGAFPSLKHKVVKNWERFR